MEPKSKRAPTLIHPILKHERDSETSFIGELPFDILKFVLEPFLIGKQVTKGPEFNVLVVKSRRKIERLIALRHNKTLFPDQKRPEGFRHRRKACTKDHFERCDVFQNEECNCQRLQDDNDDEEPSFNARWIFWSLESHRDMGEPRSIEREGKGSSFSTKLFHGLVEKDEVNLEWFSQVCELKGFICQQAIVKQVKKWLLSAHAWKFLTNLNTLLSEIDGVLKVIR